MKEQSHETGFKQKTARKKPDDERAEVPSGGRDGISGGQEEVKLEGIPRARRAKLEVFSRAPASDRYGTTHLPQLQMFSQGLDGMPSCHSQIGKKKLGDEKDEK